MGVDNERGFKGVWIPKEVWLDRRLNALDKIILTEIDSLDNGERGCWASNKRIAEFCQCSESKVSKSISHLIKCGYLYVQKFDGRQRELKSRLTENAILPSKIYEAESENMPESNTHSNPSSNTSNKKESKKEGKKANSSFDTIISEYAKGDAEITDLLGEWLKVRKAKRAAMTDRAISMNIEKIDSLAAESNLSVPEYLKEVICRGWAAFYPIKEFGGNAPKKPKMERKTESLELNDGKKTFTF